MKYKMTTARMITSTFGKPFTPNTGALPTVWAENFDQRFPGLTATLSKARALWTYQDVAKDARGIDVAMKEARKYLGEYLTKNLPGRSQRRGGDDPEPIIEFEDPAQTYLPILSDDGLTVVGHETTGWMYENGEPVLIPPEEPLEVGMYAVIFITIYPIP